MKSVGALIFALSAYISEHLFNRLSRSRGNSKENKSIDDDIDKPDCDELFVDKIKTAESQLARQQQQQQQQHYEDRSSSNSSNSINNYLRQKQPQQRLPTSTTVNNVDTSKNDEEDFFSPNRLSAKITVDVTVEFAGENTFTSQKMTKKDRTTAAMECENKQFL